MTDLAHLFVALGLLFLAGLAADQIGARTRLPRVTLLLLCGIVVGAPGLDLIPASAEALYEPLSIMALTMVAFLLGSALTWKSLRKNGVAIFSISLSIVFVTVAVVAFGLWLLGLPAEAALLLGAIATATDPAATQDAINQSGLKNRFTKQLRGIVAIDDAWGLLAFSIAVVVVQAMGSNDGFDIAHLGHAVWEIGGAIVLGAAIGLPASYLTGRLRKGEPMQTEALGIVFLAAGLAVMLEVSFLLTGIVAGMVVANMARHHSRPFHEIEHVQWPFMLLFFILAGASLDVEALYQAGILGLGYVVLRLVARILGGLLGASLCHVPPGYKPWYGLALTPQAGVAVGMALVAGQTFPEYGPLIQSLTIGTTVVFELFGPALTMFAVKRASRETG